MPYLDELGIGACYASPILRSRPGSRHGYDVCDHHVINPELGGDDGFARFASALRERGIGLILDVVPNHMGVGDLANHWWIDVLENGPASRFATYFDIDWHPSNPSLHAKVLLPVLGEFYGNVLERGEIQLAFEDGRFWLNYYSLRLPVSLHSIGGVLELCVGDMVRHDGEENDDVQELRSIMTALRLLAPRGDLGAEELAERYREKEVVRRRLARLADGNACVRASLERSIAAVNGTPGDRRSFDRLDVLLNAQSYRPAFWRVASEEINYRRFFDINELAAIRMELPEVFRETHALVLKLLVDGSATGLRIDHPDGLSDPSAYLHQLQRAYFLDRLRNRLSVRVGEELLQRQFDRLWHEAQSQRNGAARWPLFIVVEKILSEEEPLPLEWAVAGTTGYDFLVSVNGLFVDASREADWDRIYREWSGHRHEYRDVVLVSKRRIMQLSMTSEINSLAYRLDRITERNRRYRDFTLNMLRVAIREVIAALPVYRTYVAGPDHVPDRDRQFVQAAVAQAAHSNPGLASEVFEFLRDILLLRNLHEFDEADRDAVVSWVSRFQQMTGPIMAKGVEDTASYVYNRFVSLNEVGGSPERFGTSIETFHAQVRDRQQHWSAPMLSTSTHDTKRSEDVRARLNALSEMPDEWEAALKRWRDANAAFLTRIERHVAPSANDQYLIYQSLAGTWPSDPLTSETIASYRQRIIDYALKAAKEAKTHTAWTNPNLAYETALRSFIEQLLPGDVESPFIHDMAALQKRVAHFGYLNSLSQIALKLTCPGVPDLYQGCELWDFSLVDPDNRRPVDFGLRRRLLGELRKQIDASGDDLKPLVRDLLASITDGRIKLFLIHRLLTLRRERPALLESGDYQPLAVQEADPEAIVAFARRAEGRELIVAVPCRVVRLLRGWEGLPVGEVWASGRLMLSAGAFGSTYRNWFTGEVLTAAGTDENPEMPLGAVFQSFPVAVLESEHQPEKVQNRTGAASSSNAVSPAANH